MDDQCLAQPTLQLSKQSGQTAQIVFNVILESFFYS